MEPALSAVESLACAVTLAVGDGARPSRTFTLRVGEVLRVGRGAANDFVLALGGISTCQAELFLRPGAPSGEGGADLHVRDTSKNGTGVQSCDAPVKWRALPRGGLTRLQSGCKLLMPLRGLPKDANELANTLTVTVAALDGALEVAEAQVGGADIKAKTPQRRPREKKKAKPEDASRKRKREERGEERGGEALALARTREVGERHAKDRRVGDLPPVVPPRRAASEARQRKHRRHRRHDEDAEGAPRKKERRRRRREEQD